MADPAPTLPELEKTKVTLPWQAFRALLVEPPTQEDEGPPTPYTLSRSEYTVELRAKHASVRAEFDLVVLEEEAWVAAPLLLHREVALRGAWLDGAEHQLGSVEGGLGVTLRGAGSRRVAVEYLVALQGEEETARGLKFSTPRAPITLLTVKGVRRDVIPACKPAFGLDLSEEEGVLVARAALPPTSSIAFSWRPKAEKLEPKRPSLMSGKVSSRITIGERSLTLNAQVKLSVSGSPAAEVDLLLPDGFQLHAAQGEVVRDARPRDGKLRVRFAYDLLGQAALTIRGEVPLAPDQEQATAPVIALEDSPRSRGTVAVVADPRVEVEVADVRGATRIDPSELSWNPDGAPTLLAFKYVRTRPQVELRLKRHRDAAVLVATCDHAHYRMLVLEEGKVFVKAHLLVRNNARSFLELELPQGAELWSAYTGGRPTRPSGADGKALIPLLRGTEQAFEVELAYYMRRDPLGAQGQFALPMPTLDMPATYVSIALFVPTRYRHFNFDGSFKRVDAFMRAFRPPAPVSQSAAALTSNVMLAQAFLGGRPPAPSLEGGLGGEGQLPIRLPMLERGQEYRFEKTLIMTRPEPITWEYKRRRRGGNS